MRFQGFFFIICFYVIVIIVRVAIDIGIRVTAALNARLILKPQNKHLKSPSVPSLNIKPSKIRYFPLQFGLSHGAFPRRNDHILRIVPQNNNRPIFLLTDEVTLQVQISQFEGLVPFWEVEVEGIDFVVELVVELVFFHAEVLV